MLKKIMFLSVVLLLTTYALQADWQDDLAGALGPTKRWNSAQIRTITARMRKHDTAHIKDLEQRVEAVEHHEETSPSGLRGVVSKVADKVSKAMDKGSLSSAQSEHQEHARIASALEVAERNPLYQEEVLAHSIQLYQDKQALIKLERESEGIKAKQAKAGKVDKVKGFVTETLPEEAKIVSAKAAIALDKKQLERFCNKVSSHANRVAELKRKHSIAIKA